MKNVPAKKSASSQDTYLKITHARAKYLASLLAELSRATVTYCVALNCGFGSRLSAIKTKSGKDAVRRLAMDLGHTLAQAPELAEKKRARGKLKRREKKLLHSTLRRLKCLEERCAGILRDPEFQRWMKEVPVEISQEMGARHHQAAIQIPVSTNSPKSRKKSAVDALREAARSAAELNDPIHDLHGELSALNQTADEILKKVKRSDLTQDDKAA